MTVRRLTDAQRVNVPWRTAMLSRNFRLLIPIAYGLVVVLVGLFANKPVAITVTVVGAILLGVGYALGGSSHRS